ncbi:MAG: class I SAM-dependent methyltransferase [Halieaceae bacterium]|nr:class I SAM-dependent methyltransferase [Halieaceae bacterium]
MLDYGCGTGGTTSQLLARGAQVTGFDISLTRLAQALQRVTGNQGNTQTGLLQCAAETLPFPSGAFDAVLGKQILHHLELKVGHIGDCPCIASWRPCRLPGATDP